MMSQASNGTQPTAGAVMCDVPMDVLVADYQDIDTAVRDFDGSAGLVRAKKCRSRG